MNYGLDSFSRQADASNRPAAIVLGASVNGLSFARSLGRRGVSVLLLDDAPLLGSHTRYAVFRQLPSVRHDPDTWVEFLGELAEDLARPPVLFATSDAHNVLIARHSEVLAGSLRFLVPDPETMDRIVNKRLQYELARRIGIPIPETHFPGSVHEIAQLADSLTYPRILKPYRAHIGREKISKKKVLLLGSSQELVAAFTSLAEQNAEFMVQEVIPGGDTALFGYLAFWNEKGEEVCFLTKRKLRQNPPLFGDGSLQMSVDEPGVAEQSRRLLQALNYRGFVGVEFKRDPRDGTFRLMEINPRTVSGNQLAVTAGLDFPWIGYLHLSGDVSESNRDYAYQPGTVYVNEEWDFKAYLALRRKGELTFRSWVKSLRPARAFAVGAWDDPGPFLAMLVRFGRAAVRSLLGRGD